MFNIHARSDRLADPMYAPASTHQMTLACKVSGTSLQSKFGLALSRNHFNTAGSTYIPHISPGIFREFPAPDRPVSSG